MEYIIYFLSYRISPLKYLFLVATGEFSFLRTAPGFLNVWKSEQSAQRHPKETTHQTFRKKVSNNFRPREKVSHKFQPQSIRSNSDPMCLTTYGSPFQAPHTWFYLAGDCCSLSSRRDYFLAYIRNELTKWYMRDIKLACPKRYFLYCHSHKHKHKQPFKKHKQKYKLFSSKHMP